MKREELQAIEGITPEQIDAIMGLHQKDVLGWQNKFNTQQTQIDTLNTKVSEFNGVDVKKLQKDFDDLQTKYDADMAAKDKDFAKQMYFNGIQFTSNLAKSAAIAEFDKKGLEFKDGKFVGADEFIEELKKDNPTAFVSKEGNKDEGNKEPEPKPFSSGLQQGSASGSAQLDPVTVRFKELNPDIEI